MRIITGRARGLRLLTPKNYDVRPTTDRVKESLFGILGTRVQDARVLDAFAGTGNLGLEAWSRGAAHITFVDESAESLRLVRGNIAKARAEQDTTVCRGNVLSLLTTFRNKGLQFDLVFADPPYGKGLNDRLVAGLLETGVLVPGGLLVLEYAKQDPLPALPESFDQIRTEKYGDTIISIILWK